MHLREHADASPCAGQESDQVSGVTLQYHYDNVGNRTWIYDTVGGEEVSIYDSAHQLRRRMQSAHDWIDFVYDADGRVIAQTSHHDAESSPDDSTAPKIVGMAVNGGKIQAVDLFGHTPYLFGQQSVVVQILVAFNQPVTLAAGAFTIQNLAADVNVVGSTTPSEDDVDVIATAVAGSNNTQFILTFAGDGVIPCDNSSGIGTGATTFNILKGGLYRLVTHKELVTNADDEPMADDHKDVFWTFFGAVDGSDVVINPDDWSAVAATYGSLSIFSTTTGSSGEFGPWPRYIAAFDWTLNGAIDTDDLDAFLSNFGTEWDWFGSVYSANDLVAFTATRYDADGRVIEQMSSDHLAQGMMDFRYDYDWAGEVVTKSENGDETKYGYDGAGQLTTETVANNDDESFDTTTYAYDAAGNRTSVTTPSATQTYTRGDGSGSGVDGNRYGTDGVWNFFYDGHTNATSAGEGNLTKKAKIGTSEAWTYLYDNRNHLIKAEHTTNGSLIDFRVEYVYDANGNRVESVRDANGDTFGEPVITWYTLDGENPARMPGIGLENVDVWAETTDSGSLTTRYMHGDGVDQLLGRWTATGSGSGQFWILTDNLGSVRGVVSTGGTLLDKVHYAAFGNITAETNPTYRGNYGFTGGQFDDRTGFVSHHDREYDLNLGRWVTQDPIGFSAGDANLYRYVSNSSTNFGDPSGMDIITTIPGTPHSMPCPNGDVILPSQSSNQGSLNRRDPQSLNLNPPTTPEGRLSQEILDTTQREWQQLFGNPIQPRTIRIQLLSLVSILRLHPLIGVFAATQELGTGRSLESGERLGVGGTILAGLQLLPLVPIRYLRGLIGLNAQSGRGVWNLHPFQRGRVIEQQLGQNLPRNFPIIDRFQNGVATSIKSMDLAAPTYANARNITTTGRAYIDSVAGFRGRNWAGVYIRPGDITARGLDLAVPAGATQAQQQALQGLVTYGAQNGVTVRIMVVP